MPMSQEISLTPGETYTGEITIANPASATSDVSYEATISPYSVVGTSYGADLISPSSRTEITDWLTLDNTSGTLSPNGTVKLHFTIKVPASATPGGQYATIKVTSKSNTSTDSGLSIGNVYEIASIIYANVAGEVVREGSVTSQYIPSFTTTSDFTSTATITNTGTTHEDALVTFTITNSFNGSTIYPASGADKGINEIIMPDTTRDLSYHFDNMPFLGVVNATQTIEYNGETYSISQNIFICPIWFMIIIGAALLSLVTLIVLRIKKSRKTKHTSAL